MPDPTDARCEMDQAHRQRVCALLTETGCSPEFSKQADFLAAYNAVLLKDLLLATNELLIYKQNEVHR
jgi:hypothetical protein